MAKLKLMKHHTLKNTYSCSYTKIFFYLEPASGQNSNLYLNVVHFFNTNIRHLWLLWTVVSLYSCLIHAILVDKTQAKVPALDVDVLVYVMRDAITLITNTATSELKP